MSDQKLEPEVEREIEEKATEIARLKSTIAMIPAPAVLELVRAQRLAGRAEHKEMCATDRWRLRERIRGWESAHQSQKERADFAESEIVSLRAALAGRISVSVEEIEAPLIAAANAAEAREKVAVDSLVSMNQLANKAMKERDAALAEREDALSYAAEVAHGITHYSGCLGPNDTTDVVCCRCRMETAQAEVERLAALRLGEFKEYRDRIVKAEEALEVRTGCSREKP